MCACALHKFLCFADFELEEQIPLSSFLVGRLIKKAEHTMHIRNLEID